MIVAYLTTIPYAQYCETPTAYNLPRATQLLSKGCLVSIRGDEVYLYSGESSPIPVGTLLNDTFPYGLALVCGKSDPEHATVWIIEQERVI